MFSTRSNLIRAIMGLNIAVFLAWNMVPAWRDAMAQHFLVSWDALLAGRIWTLWGSIFSHVGFLHLFLNMFVLGSFGPLLVTVLGPLRFLAFYLYAGAVASFCHSLVSKFLLGEPGLPALGASGAIAGMILVFSLMFPRERILLFGIIPLPALWGAVLFVALDLWGLWTQTQGGGLPIGYGAHLGGAGAGLIYYFLWLRGHRSRPGFRGF